ncbi:MULTISPECIES: fimbrial protein [Atlantibacter]|uniref:fimbrial protein n=1 Tax=Atlantibacter TaxID=1903434 RepID=UPI0019320C21|nr:MULTISPECIES: fimbrial protein [Atlantibacter]MBL7637102.1 fimbrial protein [Atlantibacter hermannii]MBL7674047.1 fimbrial protein [Atlantibacter hermannii]MCZ7834725.1 fimbrial protein [Atlantibacter hermannii]
MKKSILGLAVSALFVVGAAQATTNDVSATLSVTGTVTNADTGCTVLLNNTAVDVTGDITTMPTQGAPAIPAKFVSMNIIGGAVCDDMLANNKIAYKFVGTADNADGTVLANANTGEGAATGVGIGLYNEKGDVINLNSGTLAAKDTPTKLGLGLVKLTGQQAVTGTVQGSLTIQVERL